MRTITRTSCPIAADLRRQSPAGYGGARPCAAAGMQLSLKRMAGTGATTTAGLHKRPSIKAAIDPSLCLTASAAPSADHKSP